MGAEARDAARQLTMHRTPIHHKAFFSPNVNGAEVEKPWVKGKEGKRVYSIRIKVLRWSQETMVLSNRSPSPHAGTEMVLGPILFGNFIINREVTGGIRINSVTEAELRL